jgi:hypothetical protein
MGRGGLWRNLPEPARLISSRPLNGNRRPEIARADILSIVERSNSWRRALVSSRTLAVLFFAFICQPLGIRRSWFVALSSTRCGGLSRGIGPDFATLLSAPTVAATASQRATGNQRSRLNTIHGRAGQRPRQSAIDELKLKAPDRPAAQPPGRRRLGREHPAVRDVVESLLSERRLRRSSQLRRDASGPCIDVRPVPEIAFRHEHPRSRNESGRSM